jgi:hypothetical protein
VPAPVLHAEWTAALRSGDFEGAWRISDRSLHEYCASGAIKHSGERHLQRIWRGEDLRNQRVLVRCYHGLGDTLQFIRFAGPFRELAREVIVWAQPELLSLVRGVEGVDKAIPLHDGTPDVEYDVDIEIMELAHALRATPGVVASAVPYLRAPDKPAPSLKPASLSIGLVWEVGNWDKRRSVPPHLLGRLSAETGARLYSLQHGQQRAEAATIPAEDIGVPDIAALSAVILGLDLIITVDTMVAHLAGALGAPVWTMLHADCDWRWPSCGRSSIWYPTMKLFHQRTAGDWTVVITEMIDELNGTMCAPKVKALC